MIKSEKISKKNARRSIVLNKNVTRGQVLGKDDLICKRPATGISPVEFDNVIGKKIRYNLKEDHILRTKDLV
jgi:N-acetylneuraminate synthase